MNLINQVLNDLERRGAPVAQSGSSIRVVPAMPRWGRFAMLFGAGVGAVAVLGVLWALRPHGIPPSVASAEPRRAPPARAISAAPPLLPSAAASGVRGPSESAVPASRLSLELAALPAPERAGEPRAASGAAHALPKPVPRHRAGTHPSAQPPRDEAARQEEAPIKRVSPHQQADAEYALAADLAQQGRKAEARQHLEAALKLDPAQEEARQMLAGLLLEDRRGADAESLLRQGLQGNPRQLAFAMLLARVQVERNALNEAVVTLQQMAPYAGEQAGYHAFLAALLQRQERHEDAVTHYQIALRQSANSGVWLMGLGMSLQALNRNEEARNAYRHALESQSLSAELQEFVERRLKALAAAP